MPKLTDADVETTVFALAHSVRKLEALSDDTQERRTLVVCLRVSLSFFEAISEGRADANALTRAAVQP